MLDSSITGGNYVGGVAGMNIGTIQSVTNNNDGNSGLITGTSNIGGIAGYNNGSIELSQNTSSTSAATVTGPNAVGGIAGYNDVNGVLTQDINSGTVQGSGVVGSYFGGIVGDNNGVVSQSINTGNVGGGDEQYVGGIAGYNVGQVDDSYSGGGTFAGTINGLHYVGGIIGFNDNGGTFETSYNTSMVESSDAATAGGLVGTNFGIARHAYYDNQTTGQTVAIGNNQDVADTSDVPAGGYTTAQLMDARNFSQGSSPVQWDFTPAHGEGQHGIWAINAYNSNGQINNGLPVLQFQYPADAQVTATNGTQYFGYQPGYTVTGNGANNFPTYVPNPTLTVTGDRNAGGTQEITVSGTPNVPGYEVEYVNGTTNIIPDPITITANSYTIPSGATPPPFTATYSGFQPNGSPSDLNAVLTFTENPPGNANGVHTITPGGQFSSNYDITYVNGTLTVGRASMPGAQFTTFETELENAQQNFASDPTNGLDPTFFLLFLNVPGLGGDEIGAINDPPGDDLSFASGTSNLPAFDRLVTSSTGVVEIIDGVIVIGCPASGNPVFLSNPGKCLPEDAIGALRGVLSSGTYNQLLPYTHAKH